MSYDTKLDCNDCVCLIPPGELILNLNKSSGQKIPAECVKKTIKSTGYDKFGNNITLLHSQTKIDSVTTDCINEKNITFHFSLMKRHLINIDRYLRQ